jgi:glutamyl-tRNA synthetase
VLRIEDTDEVRSTKESEESLLRDLRWLDLDWDEGPDVGGAFGPYRQSERLEEYRAIVARLLESGHAYRSWASDEELDEDRVRAEREGRPFRYDRAAHAITDDEEKRRLAAGELPAIRLVVPGGDIVVDDLVRGEVRFPDGMFADFVILRSNGFPTYNFACAVDDISMEITHVLRGEEHLANTGKQILVARALGAETPRYAHLPLILDQDRSKLSKRSGGATVGELRERGFLAEGAVNMLALQGWHPSGDEEKLSRDELLREFRLEKVRKAGGIYDLAKMEALNVRWLAETPPTDLAERLVPFLERAGVADAARKSARAAEAFRQGAHFLGDIAREVAALESDPTLPELPADFDAGAVGELFVTIEASLRDVESLDDGAFKPLLAAAGKQAGVKGKALFMPVRLAISGSEHGPDLAIVGAWLGPERVAARLARARDVWSLAERGT